MFFLLFWQLPFVIDNIFVLLDLASVCYFFCWLYVLARFFLIHVLFLISLFLFSLTFWLNLSLDYRGTCPPSLEIVPTAL